MFGTILGAISTKNGSKKRCPKSFKIDSPGGKICPRSAPGGPRSGPRGPKTAPGPQKIPKFGFRAALAAKWAHLAPKSPPEASRRLFWTPPRDDFPPSGGRFSHLFFHSPGSLFKTVLWTKPRQAYGQHRSTSLCSFSMFDLVRRRTADQEVLINRRHFRQLFEVG